MSEKCKRKVVWWYWIAETYDMSRVVVVVVVHVTHPSGQSPTDNGLTTSSAT